jgi:uncharacterized protein DUF1844
MNEEEKGFVIKDRRSFDEKGDLKENEPEKVEKPEKGAPGAGKAGEEPQKDEQPTPLPEVNFSSLIFSLSSSALFHLGEAPDPSTGEKKKDLPLAKHTIDIIAMLKEKTQGNLADDEKKFLEIVLSDLQLRYVSAVE